MERIDDVEKMFKDIGRQNLIKNTEGFCIIQVDDNGFCKPVTHNHK